MLASGELNGAQRSESGVWLWGKAVSRLVSPHQPCRRQVLWQRDRESVGRAHIVSDRVPALTPSRAGTSQLGAVEFSPDQRSCAELLEPMPESAPKHENLAGHGAGTGRAVRALIWSLIPKRYESVLLGDQRGPVPLTRRQGAQDNPDTASRRSALNSFRGSVDRGRPSASMRSSSA